jgi:hypothetical protein
MAKCLSAKCLSAKCLSAKCLSAKCLSIKWFSIKRHDRKEIYLKVKFMNLYSYTPSSTVAEHMTLNPKIEGLNHRDRSKPRERTLKKIM